MKKIGVLAFCLLLAPAAARAKPKVLLGIDVLEKENFAPLKGKRVGLITNHTGLDGQGRNTVDVLAQAPGVKLAALFAPEHGIRGVEKDGQEIADGRDPKTGAPVYSLYGKNKRPAPEMLQGLDALVFDIQDVGTRFYTYTTTLAYALEEAAKAHIEFVVLDRPNPITGAVLEGEPLDASVNHFTAYLRVPVRHGMTVGEIATWYNRTAKLGAKLTVVKMENWNRVMWWDQTKLRFHPTSPNLRDPEAALLYPGVGAFEATNVSVGRGTSKPFTIFGAPWIDGEQLAEDLNFFLLPGVEFKPAQFTPKDDLYKGVACSGVKIKVTDRNTFRPADLFIYAMGVMREDYPDNFIPRWDEIARVTGPETRRMLERNASAEEILTYVHEKVRRFRESAQPDLLYP